MNTLYIHSLIEYEYQDVPVYVVLILQKVLREDVKELFKYEVDRSSPSNKLRDFMNWSRDIMDDIKYTRRVISNPISRFFVKKWWDLFGNMFRLVCLGIVMCDIEFVGLIKLNEYKEYNPSTCRWVNARKM